MLRHFLRWLVAREDLDELDRWRRMSREYGAVLRGHADVDLVLQHLTAAATQADGIATPQRHPGLPSVATPGELKAEVRRRFDERLKLREERHARVRQQEGERLSVHVGRLSRDVIALSREARRLMDVEEALAWLDGKDATVIQTAAGFIVVGRWGAILSGTGNGAAVAHPDRVSALCAAHLHALTATTGEEHELHKPSRGNNARTA